jgi:hypothetical protein
MFSHGLHEGVECVWYSIACDGSLHDIVPDTFEELVDRDLLIRNPRLLLQLEEFSHEGIERFSFKR